ncbi:MAG: betaine--homocysteine S-methyltransferase [Rhodospirillales bacterium]|nr:betaine--homocysteine S-methyltransferase [Rhodospirillales bacterium]
MSLPHDARLGHLLAERDVLIADGATGTNLFARGLETGDAPELWNVDHPDRVLDHHRCMVEAEADIILTNSFGGTRNRLKLHQAHDRVTELNLAAARLARQIADAADHPVLVSGSMGPTGEIMVPVGELTHEEATAAFGEQAAALAEGGADMIWIETMSSEEEARAAIEGSESSGLPIVCTMTFDTNGRTMMGVTPEGAANFFGASQPRLAACGANCGNGFGELVAAVAGIGAACEADRVLIAKANCGLPEYVDGEIRYSGTPEIMRTYARLARDAGARIIGGCCGSTPEHVAAMADELRGYVPGERPDLAVIESVLGLNRVAPPPDAEGRKRRSRRRT